MTVSTTQVPPMPFRGDGGSVLTLTAQGAGTNVSTVQRNEPVAAPPARGIVLGINISAISGSGASLTVTLKGVDGASGQAYTLLASAALNSPGFTTLTIFPGATAASNSVANAGLPELWEVSAAIAGTTPSVTATIGASYLY